MLYLGIDLHSKQLTISLRDEEGEVLLRRQVSTYGEQPREFLEGVARQAGDAHALSEILWVNRARLLAGRKVQGVRRVVPPTPQDRRPPLSRRCSVHAVVRKHQLRPTDFRVAAGGTNRTAGAWAATIIRSHGPNRPARSG